MYESISKFIDSRIIVYKPRTIKLTNFLLEDCHVVGIKNAATRNCAIFIPGGSKVCGEIHRESQEFLHLYTVP